MRRWFAHAFSKIVALCLSPWIWLTPRAKVYKLLSYGILVLLALTLVDQMFVLPAFEGWVAVFSLGSAIALSFYYVWRWYQDEAMDVPREWIAPVRRE